MNPRVPALLQPLVQAYLLQIEQALPGFVCGFYLVGSVALGGFNSRHSDVDCVALISRRATPGDRQQLEAIHKAIQQQFPQWKLETIYLQPDDLGRFENEVEPFPCYHDNRLTLSTTFEMNSITWWILKERGIALLGPEPNELPFTVEWGLLLHRMHQNLNSYWLGWTKRPGALLVLLSDYGIQWAVLGVLRQFYTFREHAIVTKTEAGEYALTCVPARWHRLIHEAIALRETTPQARKSLYRLRLLRAIEAVQFLKFIVRTCNAEWNPSAKEVME